MSGTLHKKQTIASLHDVRNIHHILEIASKPLHLISCMQNCNLLNTHELCSYCEMPKSLIMHKNSPVQYALQCKKCHTTTQLSKGTFFEKSKVNFESALLSLFAWVCRVKARSTAALYGIKLPRVVKLYENFREICSIKLSQSPIVIGGPDDIVEVDDKLYVKNSVDKNLNPYEEYIIGLYSHEGRVGVLEMVDNRKGSTILSVIVKHVRPGTTVWTNDCDGLQFLYQHGFSHQTFQRSGVHMEYMSDFWSQIKIYLLRNCRVRPEQYTPDYLNEFMWMGRYGRTHIEAFHNMVKHIAECHNSKINTKEI